MSLARLAELADALQRRVLVEKSADLRPQQLLLFTEAEIHVLKYPLGMA